MTASTSRSAFFTNAFFLEVIEESFFGLEEDTYKAGFTKDLFTLDGIAVDTTFTGRDRLHYMEKN